MIDRLSAMADRVAALRGWARWFAAFACGLAFAMAQPPIGLWPLIFVAGPILYHLWRRADGRPAFGLGWAFGAGYFGFGLHWIVEPFLVEPEIYGWMAPPALVLFSFGLGLFPATGFWLAAMARARGAAALPALVIGWGGMELARSYVLTGFPWALPAYVWADTPVAQIASVVGPYALTLLTIAAAMTPAVSAGCGWRRIIPTLTIMAFTGGGWIWGDARLAPADITDQPIIRIVQPNIPQMRKWDVDQIRPHFERHLNLTAQASERTAPSVIVWPESAVTFPIDMADAAQGEIAKAANGAEVILGSLRINGGPEMADKTPRRWRNSLFLLDGNGALSKPSDKIHLVPFGEYLPLEAMLNQFGLLALAQRGAGMVPGEVPVMLSSATAGPFAPMICYEVIFPREVAAAAVGADWIALVTNDAWFGGWAGPIQHLMQAQMRAIETGLPIARSANTGISTMIDPYGRLVATLPLGEQGIIDAALPRRVETTYSALGEIGTGIILILLIAAVFLARRVETDGAIP